MSVPRPVHSRCVTDHPGLQVPQNANAEAIKRARKQMSFKVHPDRCKLPQAKDAFHRINEAADALLNV